jgi:hypothetical protein
MKYQYTIAKKPGTYLKTYVAQITGPDPVYFLHRRFLERLLCADDGKNPTYYYNLPGHGVFEQCVKCIDKRTGEIVWKKRSWFVYYQRTIYPIEYRDVLYARFNLEMQYRKLPNAA